MSAFLDYTGLSYFWGKISTILGDKVDKVSGKGLSTNDYTTAEKEKLDGIAAGANAYTLPTASSSTLGGIKVGSGLSISDGTLSADAQAVSVMTGATSGAAGTEGIVPAPAAGDQAKYLQGDGTWDTPAARHGTGTGAVIEGGHSASGDYSHAEGYGIASGSYSHAEGYFTTAFGAYSHAEGYNTTAISTSQHVFGSYNKSDSTGTYVEIVGNGNSSAKSNARTLDWSGNEVLAGSCTATSFSGSGANLTSLNASNITSGTIPVARLPLPTVSSSDNGKVLGVVDGAWALIELTSANGVSF